MKYMLKRAVLISKLCNDEDGANIDLYLIYALLSFTTGKKTTLENVHDAWATWKHSRGLDTHKSLIPFCELTKEVQELDRPYMEAIHISSNIGA